MTWRTVVVLVVPDSLGQPQLTRINVGMNALAVNNTLGFEGDDDMMERYRKNNTEESERQDRSEWSGSKPRDPARTFPTLSGTDRPAASNHPQLDAPSPRGSSSALLRICDTCDACVSSEADDAYCLRQ